MSHSGRESALPVEKQNKYVLKVGSAKMGAKGWAVRVEDEFCTLGGIQVGRVELESTLPDALTGLI